MFLSAGRVKESRHTGTQAHDTPRCLVTSAATRYSRMQVSFAVLSLQRQPSALKMPLQAEYRQEETTQLRVTAPSVEVKSKAITPSASEHQSDRTLDSITSQVRVIVSWSFHVPGHVRAPSYCGTTGKVRCVSKVTTWSQSASDVISIGTHHWMLLNSFQTDIYVSIYLVKYNKQNVLLY